MTTSAAPIGGDPFWRTTAAPIDYVEIRRLHQLVRLGLATAVAVLGAVALAQGVTGWLYLLAPAAAAGSHAARQLARGKGGPLPSLLLDVTLLGMLISALGDVPQAEVAAVAYIAAGALVMLPPRRAAGVLAYTGAWAVVVATLSPLTTLQADAGAVAFDRLTALVLLVLLAGLLATASRALYRFRRRQDSALGAERAANQLKDEFVSMVSHEFRTPLTSIAGFVEELRESWPRLSRHEVCEFLDIIHSQTVHLSHLVEDVLVIPRLEAGRLPFAPEQFELRPLANEVMRLLLGANGGEADVAIPGGVYVYADPQRVIQVLRNLVENADKYGGDQILLEGEPDGPAHYRVVVADNGPGVPQSTTERIFNVFEQVTKGDARTDSGMGLGLPIAQRLVAAMGGKLWHEPRFPTGSRFCFTLPAGRMPARGKVLADEAQPLSDSGPGDASPQPTGARFGSL